LFDDRNGGDSYFQIFLAFEAIIADSITVRTEDAGIFADAKIFAEFTPNLADNLQEAATAGGYDHFNWLDEPGGRGRGGRRIGGVCDAHGQVFDMRRRSGLMVSSLIGGSRLEVRLDTPSVLQTGPPPLHTNPFS
jgi:hypothetical protein